MAHFSSKEAFIDSLFDDRGLFLSDDRVDEVNCTGHCMEDHHGGTGNTYGEPSFRNVGRVDNIIGEHHRNYSSGCCVEFVEDANVEMSPEADVGWVPTEGMVFQQVVEAFIKYSEYARRCGFEVRFRSSELSPRSRKVVEAKGVEIPRRKRMSRGIGRNWLHDGYEFCSRVRLQCVKGEKWRPKRCSIADRPIRTQATNCKAGVYLQKNGDGNWVFRKVRLDHNHECDPNTTRFMKSYRIVTGVDEMQIVVGDRAGVTPSRAYMNFIVGHGGIENVPFSIQDSHSVLRRWRMKGMENGDFNAMQTFFNEMKALSDGFFYAYDTDVEGRVKNVFWADEHSRAAYDDFGDVLCFDTTHMKNRYKMPPAPFIGVNHHGQSILLGCALVSKEDTESFTWVFKTWLSCMRMKMPKYIMTDQCQAIGTGKVVKYVEGNAVRFVFPISRHRWCLWHVMKNAELHLRKQKNWQDMRKELADIVHCSCDSDEFEGDWSDFIIKYSLQESDWLNKMYDLRHRWVPAYFLDEFWAGLQSTQRSEGMNNFFRSYVNVNTGLKQFAEQYCLAVGKRVDDELKEDWRSKNKPVKCATVFASEKIFQRFYTVRKFIEFQVEAKGVVYVNTERVSVDDGIQYHIVTDKCARKGFGRMGTRKFGVSFEPGSNSTRCSCKMFEFKGIICRHIVAVWKNEDVNEIPSMYILDRWRKDKFRMSSVVKIPNHTHAFGISDDERRLRKLQASMRAISDYAMGHEVICDYVLLELDELYGKCKTMLESSEDGVRIDGLGRHHKRRAENGRCGAESNPVTFDRVLDPVDCRGRGRVPTHRKGYKVGKGKGSKSGKGKKKAGVGNGRNIVGDKGREARATETKGIVHKGGTSGQLNIQSERPVTFHKFM